jgi:hypothetical protein
VYDSGAPRSPTPWRRPRGRRRVHRRPLTARRSRRGRDLYDTARRCSRSISCRATARSRALLPVRLVARRRCARRRALHQRRGARKAAW